MKAIVYYGHGSPDVLRCEEIARPTPGDGEVLLKVRAASVNALDWRSVRGGPGFLRWLRGSKPKLTRLGLDVAGVVEAVGGGVTRFKPGDAVFGTCHGAFAESVCAAESALAAKPEQVTFEEAAAVPVAGLTALQGLRDKGRVRAGQEVLVNGASGGVGSFAVQIAKAFGAGVTGVCSTRNLEMVRSIGADRVIDYTREDFTEGGERYDLLFDCVGNHSLSACRRVLRPSGRCVIAGGPDEVWFLRTALKTLALAPVARRRCVLFIARRSQEDLAVLHDLMAAGKVTPVIDRSYALTEVPEAVRYLEAGHARGKVVVSV